MVMVKAISKGSMGFKKNKTLGKTSTTTRKFHEVLVMLMGFEV